MVDEFRARAAEWLAEHTPRDVPEGFVESAPALKAWQQALYDGEWLGLAWPREYGGQGQTMAEQLVFIEEMVRARAPMPLNVLGLEIIGPTILHFGTDEQKRRYLPPLLRGDEIWCQGFSEPGAGSDLAALSTRAELDGDEFVINGQKVWTSHAQVADWCGLLARTNREAKPHAGISFLLVPMDSPGVSVRPIVQMTGSPEFCEVFFEDVRIPEANLLGGLDKGWNVAMTTLAFERGPYTLRRNAEVRTLWGDLVGALRDHDDPGIVRRVGMGEIMVEALDAVCRRTLRDILASRVGEHGSMDKLLAAEAEAEIFGLGLDALGPWAMQGGGIGLDAHRWSREYMLGRSAAIYGGSSEIQRNIVASRTLGLPRS